MTKQSGTRLQPELSYWWFQGNTNYFLEWLGEMQTPRMIDTDKLGWKTDVDPAFIPAFGTYGPLEPAHNSLILLHWVYMEFCLGDHAAFLVG